MTEEVKAKASLNICDARYRYLTICTGLYETFVSCCCCCFFFKIFQYISICAVLDINYSDVKWPQANGKTGANK